MRYFIQFSNDCDVYSYSNIVTISSMEKWFSDEDFNKIKTMKETQENITASLMILGENESLLRLYKFNEVIKTDGNLLVFLCNEQCDGVDRLLTLYVHNNCNETPSTTPFIELMTDNYIDNACFIGRGKKAYFEIY